jgi:hypothetical protein
MNQREYEQWKAGRWKSELRCCRRRFLSKAYGCYWPDAANEISKRLSYPEKIEDSIFANCITD